MITQEMIDTSGSVTNAGFKLLRSVPKRGTKAWDDRELLRYKMGSRCMSFGPLDADAHYGRTVRLRVLHATDWLDD